MEHFIEFLGFLLSQHFVRGYHEFFQKSEQIFEENKIDQDKCGAEAWGYASAGKFYYSVEWRRSTWVI